MFSESKRKLYYISSSWIEPYFPFRSFTKLPGLYAGFLQDMFQYRALKDSEQICLLDTLPQLLDRTSSTKFDAHYLYQSVWALREIHESNARRHVDIGSLGLFVGMLTAITDVTFVDIRPLQLSIPGFEACEGSILELPLRSNTVASLSCLHVAEHIGLGRYGDPLDTQGTRKAAYELTRILSPGGRLYFSLPVGEPRVCFNAHRIHSPETILDYFADLDLIDFSAVDDRSRFLPVANPRDLASASFACGLFTFSKPKS